MPKFFKFLFYSPITSFTNAFYVNPHGDNSGITLSPITQSQVTPLDMHANNMKNYSSAQKVRNVDGNFFLVENGLKHSGKNVETNSDDQIDLKSKRPAPQVPSLKQKFDRNNHAVHPLKINHVKNELERSADSLYQNDSELETIPDGDAFFFSNVPQNIDSKHKLISNKHNNASTVNSYDDASDDKSNSLSNDILVVYNSDFRNLELAAAYRNFTPDYERNHIGYYPPKSRNAFQRRNEKKLGNSIKYKNVFFLNGDGNPGTNKSNLQHDEPPLIVINSNPHKNDSSNNNLFVIKNDNNAKINKTSIKNGDIRNNNDYMYFYNGHVG